MKYTAKEVLILNHLADAWNLFVDLPSQHPTSNIEFMQAIHQCQLQIMGRLAERADPIMHPNASTEQEATQ